MIDSASLKSVRYIELYILKTIDYIHAARAIDLSLSKSSKLELHIVYMMKYGGYLLTESALLIKAKMRSGSFCFQFGNFPTGNPIVYVVSEG